MITPTRVKTFGWMRSATQVSMIARSGNMQTAPTAPVKVIRVGASGWSLLQWGVQTRSGNAT
jgi:hypothetical protein